MVRALASHARGQWFKSTTAHLFSSSGRGVLFRIDLAQREVVSYVAAPLSGVPHTGRVLPINAERCQCRSGAARPLGWGVYPGTASGMYYIRGRLNRTLEIGSQFLNVSPKTAPSPPFTLSKTGGTLVIVSVNAGRDCTGHGHRVSRYHAAFRVNTVDPSEVRRSCRKIPGCCGMALVARPGAIGSKRGSG